MCLGTFQSRAQQSKFMEIPQTVLSYQKGQFTRDQVYKSTQRVNSYQGRHALLLTPVVELKRLSTKWISNLPLCVQSVSEEGLNQWLGHNPTGQSDSSRREFSLKTNPERRDKPNENMEDRWRENDSLCSVSCVGVSALLVNLFFQTL